MKKYSNCFCVFGRNVHRNVTYFFVAPIVHIFTTSIRSFVQNHKCAACNFYILYKYIIMATAFDVNCRTKMSFINIVDVAQICAWTFLLFRSHPILNGKIRAYCGGDGSNGSPNCFNDIKRCAVSHGLILQSKKISER